MQKKIDVSVPNKTLDKAKGEKGDTRVESASLHDSSFEAKQHESSKQAQSISGATADNVASTAFMKSSSIEKECEILENENDFGSFDGGFAPRQSHVETIVDSDEEIDYSFAQKAVDEIDKERDNLIYSFGISKIFAPKVENTSNGQKFVHETVDIACLANKKIIFFATGPQFPKERHNHLELKDYVRELAVEVQHLGDVESDLAREFVVVVLWRGKSKEEFDKFMENQPFYAVCFEDRTTVNTLCLSLGIDGAVFAQRRQRVIVYSRQDGIISSHGKACLFHNRAKCIEEWRNREPGISTFKAWLGRISPF